LRLIDIIDAMRRQLGLRARPAAPPSEIDGPLSRPGMIKEEGKMADQADDLGLPMRPARPSVQPIVPPRVTDLPRPAGDTGIAGEFGTAPKSDRVERRHMVVGREISLSGDISSCDRLVVEGSVEANLHECRELNVAEGGLFKGNASIELAEVRGRFEGELVVRKRLLIRAAGHVSGSVIYGELEIEAGGKISGTVQAHQEDVTTAYLGRVRVG
jgi:cytoskeletal protein CcmA (bactofilin family)